MKISIIGGAGFLGSSTAFNIAMKNLVDEIVLFDTRKNVVQHHAMDLATATVDCDVLIRTGSDEDLSGSDIVIISASISQSQISSRMELLPGNLPIICDIADLITRYCPKAIVILASAPVGPLNYALYLCTGKERGELLGYTLNDSLRFRIMAAQALGLKPSQVTGMTIGEHGDSQVPLFSSLRVNNQPILVDEEFKHQIRQKVHGILPSYVSLNTGLTPGWTSSTGITSLVNAIVKDTRELIPCSVVLDGEFGYHDLSIAVPAIIGKAGVQEIPQLSLANDEKELLNISADILLKAMHQVEDTIKANRNKPSSIN